MRREHFHPFTLGGTREDELGAAGHFGEYGELLAGSAANIEAGGAHGGDVERHRFAGGIHAVQNIGGFQKIGVDPQAGISGHLDAKPFAGFASLGGCDVDLFENVDRLVFVKLKYERAEDRGAPAGANAGAIHQTNPNGRIGDRLNGGRAGGGCWGGWSSRGGQRRNRCRCRYGWDHRCGRNRHGGRRRGDRGEGHRRYWCGHSRDSGCRRHGSGRRGRCGKGFGLALSHE